MQMGRVHLRMRCSCRLPSLPTHKKLGPVKHFAAGWECLSLVQTGNKTELSTAIDSLRVFSSRSWARPRDRSGYWPLTGPDRDQNHEFPLASHTREKVNPAQSVALYCRQPRRPNSRTSSILRWSRDLSFDPLSTLRGHAIFESAPHLTSLRSGPAICTAYYQPR